MKPAHIFEGNECSQHGTGAQPERQEEKLPGISYQDMIEKMESQDDGDEVVFVDNIEIKDPKTDNTEYDSCIVFEIGNIDHQEPHQGGAWTLDSRDDFYGYTDIGGAIIYWAHSLDEDSERWEIVKGEVTLSEHSQKQLDAAAHKRFDDMKDNAEMNAAADHYDDMNY